MQADNTPADSQKPDHRPVRWGMVSLLVIGVLLVGIAASVIWLINDPARVKVLTERAVSSLTGRALSIHGEFDFEIGRVIRVSAEQLTWANAPWSNGPAMLSIGEAELAVDLRSILQPPLLITKVVAQDAQLYFEWTEAGQSNWQIGTADNNSTAEPTPPFKWLLEEATLQNIDLYIRLAKQSDELHLHVQGLKQKQSELDLYPGQEMTVSATEINWTNPAWASEPTLLHIATLDATFDFDSLMQAPLIITDITARDAQVDFEWDTDGRFNWQFSPADDKAVAETVHPLPWVLDKANLQNVAIRVQHPSQTEALLINIEQATQRQDDSKHLLTVIDMTVEGKPVNIDGRIGPFPELLAAGAIDLDLAVKGPYSTLSLQGTVAKLATLQKPNLKLEWAAPEVEKDLEMFNIPVTVAGKADLRGSITPVGEGIEAQIEGSVGEFALHGSFSTESINQLEGLSLSKLNGLTVNFQSTGPSARTAGKILTIDGLPPEPYELDVQVQDTTAGLQIEALRFTTAGAVASGSGLVHDFPALNRLDFDLQMNVPNIARFSGILPGKKIPALPLSIDGKIRSNTADASDSVTASARLGTMEAQLTGVLTEKQRFADSSFDWTLKVPDAQRSGAIFGFDLQQAIQLQASGKASLNTAGLNLRSTVVKLGAHTANLKGELPLSGENAVLQLDGDVSGPNLGNLVNLFTATDEIPGLPYKLATQFSYKEPKLELRSVSGTVGSNKLKASGTLTFGKDWPVTNLQVSTEGPRFEELLQAQAIEDLPTGAYSASGGLKLSSDGTQISQLNLKTDGGLMSGSLTLGWPADPERIDFDIRANGTNLREVLPAIDDYEPAAVPFDISATGRLNKQQVNIPQVSGTLGTARINLKGNLDFSSALRSDGATLRIVGSRSADLGSVAKWPMPNAPFDISATLAGAANKLDVSDFSLKFGLSDLRGSLQLTRNAKPSIEIIASSNRLDVRPFEELYADDAPAAANSAQTTDTNNKKKREEERFIPNEPLPLDPLNSVDGSLQLTVGQFTSRRLLFRNLNVKGKLANGNLDFDGSSSFDNGGKFQVELLLQQQKGRAPHAELSTSTRNAQYELNQLDPSLQGYNLIQNVDAYLVGDGANLREIAANINGYLWLRGGGQKIATKQFGFFFGDFLTGVLDTINPFTKKSPYQTIECVVAFFEATDGVLKTAPSALLSAETMNIGAQGIINLQTEKIALNVQANPRKGLGISASSLINPFVGLRGTLEKPTLSLDPTGTIIGGGAAVATMGLSIVAESLFKRWFKSKKPCETMTQEAFKIRKKRDPAHVPTD